MKTLIKMFSLCLMLGLFVITQAQYTVSDASLLYIGSVSDDGTRATYLVDVLNASEPMVIGHLNGAGSDTGWSPDGRYVHIVHYDETENPVISLYEVDTDTTTEITNTAIDSECSSPLQWSPDGRFMAYQHTVDEQAQFVLLDTDNNSSIVFDELLLHGTLEWGVWSPTGRYIAIPFMNAENQSAALIWDTVTQNEVVAVRTAAHILKWAHDESYFVFEDRNNGEQITLYDMASGTFTTDLSSRWGAVVEGGQCVSCFRLSYGDWSAALYRYGIPDNPTPMIAVPFADNTLSRWSADGHYVTFTRTENGKASLFVLDTQSGTLTEVVTDKVAIRHVIWSPTSDYLAIGYLVEEEIPGQPVNILFSLYQPTENAITDYDYMLRDGWESSPLRWSPDGRYLIFADNEAGMIYLEVAANRELDLSAVTGVATVGRLWSRDGRYLLASGYKNSEIVARFVYDSHDNTFISLPELPEVAIPLGWRGTKNNIDLLFCGMG